MNKKILHAQSKETVVMEIYIKCLICDHRSLVSDNVKYNDTDFKSVWAGKIQVFESKMSMFRGHYNTYAKYATTMKAAGNFKVLH